MTPARFAFYEEVIVESPDPELAEINGSQGVIIGAGNEAGYWSYGILIEATGYCWSVDEPFLRSTGRMRKREEFYSDSLISVSKDGIPLDPIDE